MNYNYLDEDIIEEINKTPEKAKYLNYTNVKEFYKLSINDMARITRQISSKASLKLINEEYTGMYIDYTGDVYYYDISSDNTFGITEIDKYNDEMEKSKNERKMERNSRNAMESSESR